MKNKGLNATGFILITTLLYCSSAAAFKDSRDEKWAIFLTPQFTNSKTLHGKGGAEVTINERSSLGFGVSYNLNPHIELGLTFAASNSNYEGTLIPEETPNEPVKVSASMYTSSINFNFTYNFLSGPLTPYITANLGSTYIDSGVPTGNISSGCWYDYWYGYICTPVAQTYTSTEFNYGAGVGLRYDFNRKLYMKGGVSKNILDIRSSNTADFTTYQLIFGFMF